MTEKKTESKSWERNKEKKERKIFETFVELFNEGSYEDIKMRDIAERSNVSLGTIYRYYEKGKLSLLQKFFSKTSDLVLDPLELQAPPKKDISSFVKNYISNHLKTHREFYSLHKALYQAALSNKLDLEEAKEFLLPVLDDGSEKLKSAPVFENIDIPTELFEKTTTRIFNLVESMVHRHLYIIPIFDSDEELVVFLTEITLDLIKKAIQ